MPNFQYASTVARELGISIDEIGEIMGTKVAPRTHIEPEARVSLERSIAESDSTRRRNGAGESNSGVETVPSRRGRDKGEFTPTRLMRRKSLKLSPGDRNVLELLQQVLDGVKTAKGQRRDTKSDRRGRIAVRDVLRPERWIWMELPEFQARQDGGTLPVLHRDTINELAEPLSRLSLVSHTCRICNQEMEPPHYRGMLEHLLAGNTKLPFSPNDRSALKFPEHHKGCPSILAMMSEVEQELKEVPEGDGKEATRWKSYLVRLQADEGKLLSEYMQSEYRALSARDAMARIRAINDNVKRQREVFSQ